MRQHTRTYLIVRDIVRAVFWLGVAYGVLYVANLIVPGVWH